MRAEVTHLSGLVGAVSPPIREKHNDAVTKEAETKQQHELEPSIKEEPISGKDKPHESSERRSNILGPLCCALNLTRSGYHCLQRFGSLLVRFASEAMTKINRALGA